MHSQACKTKFLNPDNMASLSLKHLMGPAALRHLDSVEREKLEAVNWLAKSVGKGCSLVEQGEDREMISILLSGWAFRYQTLSDGRRQILDFIFAGALVGFGSGSTSPYGVETVTNCTIASLSQGQFRRILTNCPSLAIQVAERVSDSEMRAYEHMISLGRRSARERIAALIVELTSRVQCREVDLRKYMFSLPVTQMMIGDALGLSNEHVCRTLGKLADDGVIKLDHHALKVLDQEALAREAGLNPDDFVPHGNALAAAA